MENEEELESPVPGQQNEDSTILDENNDTVNRHELELSLLRDEIDKFRTDIDKYVPINMIAMYAGTEADIPDMWHLCNGQGGTVDLRDKFVYGGTYDDIGDEGGFKDIEQTLPEHVHQLDHHFHVLDPHRHTISDTHTHTIAAHSHTMNGHSHSVASHSHGLDDHNHGMSHGHTSVNSVVPAHPELLNWYNQEYMWYTTFGVAAGNNIINFVTEYNGTTVMAKVHHDAHNHVINDFSGATGSGGGGTTGPAGSGTSSVADSMNSKELTTDAANSDQTDELGEVNTQTAGAGDTYPAGSDVSGAGKNLPPYMKLAFIQKVA